MILGRASEYGMLFVSRYQNLRSSHKKQRQVSPERNLEKVVIGKSRHELPEYYWDDKLPVSQGANADYMTKVAQFVSCLQIVEAVLKSSFHNPQKNIGLANVLFHCFPSFAPPRSSEQHI